MVFQLLPTCMPLQRGAATLNEFCEALARVADLVSLPAVRRVNHDTIVYRKLLINTAWMLHKCLRSQ